MADAGELSRNLRLARPALDPTQEQRARVRAALEARLASGAGQADNGQRSGAVHKAPGAHAALAKAVAFIGIGFVLGYWFAEVRSTQGRVSEAPRLAAATPASPPPEPLVRDWTLPEPVAPEPVAPEPIALAPLASKPSASVTRRGASAAVEEPGRAPLGDPAVLPRSKKRPRALPQRVVSGAVSLGAELALLQRAERAIRSGDGALARSFVAELESRFPETTLREERAAILVLAACVLGEPGAASHARDFLARHPGSVYFDRVRALCSAQPAGGE